MFGAFVAARFLPAAPPGHEVALEHIARALPLWTGLPFAGMLLSIALFPLLAPHFWHHHYKKVAVGWAFVFFAPFFVQYGVLAAIRLTEVLLIDYVPFLILLWGLYTVSGGIYLRATLVATPALNAAFLVAGLVLASLMGTTGASMLLIRPMLRANGWRKHKAHVFVFFIFLVSNMGGLLTPLGDPPLFLGFIHGVPFFWTLQLFPEYLFVSAIVLAVFVVVDMRLIRREIENRPTHELPHRRTSFRVEGAHNFLLLFGILGAVLLSGFWHTPGLAWFGVHFEYRNVVRDLLIIVVGFVSIASTPRGVREDNGFTWEPMKEVAYLFFGIFVTIIPVLMILKAGAEGAARVLVLGVTEPWQDLLGVGHPVEFPRQRADVSDVHGPVAGAARHRAVAGDRRPERRDARAIVHAVRGGAQGGVVRGGDDGRQHLHRQRAELHGALDRQRVRREDAELLRLHAVVGDGAGAGVHAGRRGVLLGSRGKGQGARDEGAMPRPLALWRPRGRSGREVCPLPLTPCP